MKIKSVKIQAFKSYLKVEDGTFDFTQDGKKPSSFVSLYAPNGFGKTSFFDAVDFAITGQISRYSRDGRVKQNKSDCLENNQQGKRQHLLRNNEAGDTIPTEIIVDVDSRDTPFVSNHRLARRRSVDYPFTTDCNPGTEFFKKTMLSQEAIDAFLRETDAEGRYQKFATTVGGLEQVNRERFAFFAVQQDATAEIDSLDKEIRTLEAEISKLADQQNPTEEANAIVFKLNEAQVAGVSSVEFSVLESKFTQLNYESFFSKWEVFKNAIERHQHTLDTNRALAKEQLDSLLTTRRRLEDLSLLEKTEAEVKLFVKRKQQLSKLEFGKSELEDQLEQSQAEVQLIKSFEEERGAFFDHRSAVGKLNLQLKQTEEQEQKVAKKLPALGRLLEITREQIGKYRLTLEQLIASEKSAADYYTQLEKLVTGKKDKAAKFDLLKKQKQEQDSLALSFERKVTLVKCINLTNTFDAKSIDFVSADIIIRISELHQTYLADKEKLQAVQVELKRISERLDNTRLQSRQIKDLIEIASGIIADSGQSNCPLCQHKYESLADLQNQISSNPLLSDTERELTEKYQVLKHQLSELELKLKSGATLFTDEVQQILSVVSSDLRAAQLKGNALGEEIDLLLKSIQADDLQVQELRSKVLNKPKADYYEHLEGRRAELKQQVEAAELAIKAGEAEQQSFAARSGELQLELLQKRAEKVTLVESGLRFDDLKQYLSQHQIGSDVEKEKLQDFLLQQAERLEQQVLSFSSKIKASTDQIKIIVELLPLSKRSQSLKELQEDNAKLVAEIAELKSKLSSFYALLREIKLSVPTNEEDWKSVEQRTNEWRSVLSVQYNAMEAALNDAALLNTLSKQALEFRNPDELKLNLKKLQLKQKAYQNICDELSKDIEKVNAHIESKANSYFRTELINQLYCAIDPHPEFKKIKFDCKTDGKKPRLVISAINPSTGQKIAPNLTFSSAQINVLALSIFLAQALNVTDDDGQPVDCIFIDDPVQSIDSINSLSFIDLIRALCLRFDKQIIISTHDQNFHELLKKKMPSDVFPAKYLRLASFGKVVAD
jgi:exonuclease SbcC